MPGQPGLRPLSSNPPSVCLRGPGPALCVGEACPQASSEPVHYPCPGGSGSGGVAAAVVCTVPTAVGTVSSLVCTTPPSPMNPGCSGGEGLWGFPAPPPVLMLACGSVSILGAGTAEGLCGWGMSVAQREQESSGFYFLEVGLGAALRTSHSLGLVADLWSPQEDLTDQAGWRLWPS